MATMRVFLSHSHLDNDWCNRFYEELAQDDFDIWYDREGLYAGDEWVKTLERELQDRDIYLIILSPDSWASRWVQNELSLALSQHKQIVGVLYKPTEVSGFITNYQLLDVTYREPEEAAQTVAATLKRTGASAAPQAPSRQSFPSRPGEINISGEWVEEFESSYNSEKRIWTQLFLSQAGSKVTGSGIDKRYGEVDLILDGSIDGINVSLNAAIVGDNEERYEFKLTYIQHSGMMKGDKQTNRQQKGMFGKTKERNYRERIEFKRADQ